VHYGGAPVREDEGAHREDHDLDLPGAVHALLRAFSNTIY
jgi:hypothetical protein